MPQKKNPDMAELIRGKCGRVVGHHVALLHTLKSLPLTYNRDLQEDKEPVFDTVDTIQASLTVFTEMLGSITLNQQAIQAALEKGYLVATELADYLAKKEMPFREAHEITGKVVTYAISKQKSLLELGLEEFRQFSDQIDNTVYDSLTLDAAIQAKDVLGGTAPQQVAYQLQQLQEAYQWKKH